MSGIEDPQYITKQMLHHGNSLGTVLFIGSFRQKAGTTASWMQEHKVEIFNQMQTYLTMSELPLLAAIVSAGKMVVVKCTSQPSSQIFFTVLRSFKPTAFRSRSALKQFALHLLHRRTGLRYPNLINVRLLLQQCEQKMWPQCRQWCCAHENSLCQQRAWRIGS